MRLLKYLDNKVKRYLTDGERISSSKYLTDGERISSESTDGENQDDKMQMDVDVSTEELLNNVKYFYLQHPTYDQLSLFQRIFDVINRDPYGFFKLFKIKSVLPISSVNGIIIVIETRSKKKIIDNQLLVKIPQNLEKSDSITYEYYIGQVVNTLRINKLTDNFALVYGLINCNFNSTITDYIKNIAKLKYQYENTEGWSDRLSIKTKLEIQKAKLDLYIMSKNHLCEGQSPKPHIIYEYLRNIKTNKSETLESYIKRLSNPDLDITQKQTIELNIIKIMIMIMYSLQVAQDNLDFVHYDLHLGNILVIELENQEAITITYNNKKINFMSNVIAHIIDYGRSYVNPKKADKIINTGVYSDIQLESRTFNSFKAYQNALFGKQYYNGSLTDKDRPSFNRSIFRKIDFLLRLEGPNSELYYCEDTNMFYIAKIDAKTGKKYIIHNNKKYIIEEEISKYLLNTKLEYVLMMPGKKRNYIDKYNPSDISDKNDMISWLSANIYNKDLSIKVDDLTKNIDDEVLLNHYDVGVHSNKANKKYDMFRICKLVCSEMSTYNSAELQYGDLWDKLDDQLLIEYPFYINTYNVLPSDYHITDFFNISKTNADKTIKKWLKTPKDIADYLQANIKPESLSPTMELDPEHAFQIATF
jgi:hypothetical protein